MKKNIIEWAVILIVSTLVVLAVTVIEIKFYQMINTVEKNTKNISGLLDNQEGILNLLEKRD